MTWLLIIPALWLALAGGATWALAQGLAPEGSRWRRVLTPLAASLSAAKAIAAAAVGAVIALRLKAPEERPTVVDDQVAADEAAREAVEEAIAEDAVERHDFVADLLADAELVEEAAAEEAAALRLDPPDVDAAAVAARFDERTGG